MGHNVVPNDTPEKARARQELFALLNDPGFELSDDLHDPRCFSKVVKKALDGGLTDERIAALTKVPDRDDVREWAAGSRIPDPPWQKEIVRTIKGELARFETAAGYD